MNTILILGSGQIGSRHLQGVLKLNSKLLIYVADPSDVSLNLAKERALEVEHKQVVNYISNINLLPSKIDLAIVATDASVRFQVTVELIEKIKIRFLILEKVLFQNVQEYQLFSHYLQSIKLNTWVNHPRRMYLYYKNIKEEIKQRGLKKIDFIYIGNNWGIGCNAIHLIDLASFLTDSKSIQSVECDFLDPEISWTKRDKFIEFTGKLTVNFNQVSLTMTSHKQPEQGNPLLLIATEDDKWIIQEGKSISHISSNNQLIQSDYNYHDYYQSSLTTIFVEKLLNYSTCDLPTYDASEKLHVPFISELLSFQNRILQEDGVILKIT